MTHHYHQQMLTLRKHIERLLAMPLLPPSEDDPYHDFVNDHPVMRDLVMMATVADYCADEDDAGFDSLDSEAEYAIGDAHDEDWRGPFTRLLRFLPQ